MDSMERKSKMINILIHIILILVSITMLIPFVWMILTAFKSVTEATSVNPFVIFPKVWRTDCLLYTSCVLLYPVHNQFDCHQFDLEIYPGSGI